MAYGGYESGRRSEGLRSAAMVAWITYVLGLFTSWVTGPVGFIIAMVKRADAIGTPYESHFDAIIRSGLICFIGYSVGWILVFTVIGIIIGGPILLATWLYNVYVVIRGLLRISERRPY